MDFQKAKIPMTFVTFIITLAKQQEMENLAKYNEDLRMQGDLENGTPQPQQ